MAVANEAAAARHAGSFIGVLPLKILVPVAAPRVLCRIVFLTQHLSLAFPKKSVRHNRVMELCASQDDAVKSMTALKCLTHNPPPIHVTAAKTLTEVNQLI
jgi:hypothetical protein